MTSSPDGPAEDRHDDPSTRVGEVLATTERQVAQILAAAQTRAERDHRSRRAELDARAADLDARSRLLDERAAELAARSAELDRRAEASAVRDHALEERASDLADVTAELLSSALATQDQARRLASLRPIPAAATTGPVPVLHPRPATVPASVDRTGAVEASAAVARAGAEATADPVRRLPATSDPADDVQAVGPAAPDAAGPPPSSADRVDDARLVALSMAAEGRSREEVEAVVRDGLGLEDHAELLDYVFGVSAPASVVPSWPPRRPRRAG